MKVNSLDTLGRGRRVLLLQGPASWAFLHLARALEDRGAAVDRVLLCPGDRLFWPRRGVAYRGGGRGWRPWISAYMAARGVTDLVCLGDGRAWHREAIAEAYPLGIRVHVVEQGYLRPGWLTVEPDGTGGRSRLPRCPQQIRAVSQGAPVPDPPPLSAPFWAYAAMDVAWNLANLLARPFWPRQRPHALDPPPLEWMGWGGKALAAPVTAARARRAMGRIVAHHGPVFLLPLQLETDFQIRDHGPAGGMAAALKTEIAAFAAHAAPDALLVVKRHPLDNALALWARRVRLAALSAGVGGRVVYLAGGDLARLIERAAGVVTVNSTVGLTALLAGRAVRVLGRAIYDVEGLTDRRGAADFWRRPAAPDPELAAAFAAMLRATVQVPGGFDGSGVRLGAAGMAGAILSPAPF